MAQRLTPIEKFLRTDTTDRRAKYDAKREKQGLVRIAVWVPFAEKDEIKAYLDARVAAHLEKIGE